MAIDQRLLNILRCPATGLPLAQLSSRQLEALNRVIADGSVRRDDGNPVAAALSAALITVDGERVYPIEDGIPVLLVSEAIKPGTLFAAAD